MFSVTDISFSSWPDTVDYYTITVWLNTIESELECGELTNLELILGKVWRARREIEFVPVSPQRNKTLETREVENSSRELFFRQTIVCYL